MLALSDMMSRMDVRSVDVPLRERRGHKIPPTVIQVIVIRGSGTMKGGKVNRTFRRTNYRDGDAQGIQDSISIDDTIRWLLRVESRRAIPQMVEMLGRASLPSG